MTAPPIFERSIRRRGRRAVQVWVALVTAALVSGAGPQDAAKEAEDLKLQSGERPRVVQPLSPEDAADIDARKERERSGAPAPVPTGMTAAERSGPAPAAPATSPLPAYDWDAIFAGADEVDGLALALAHPDGPYSYGASHVLALALRNTTSIQRVLTAATGCGALGRLDGLVFHFVAADGTDHAILNRYSHSDNRHPHPPLEIEAQGTLVDGVDLTRLATTSGEVFDLVRASGAVTISVEIPALRLRSNAVTVELQP